ncbi:hypothetical protein J3D43_003970 [Paenibacillus xylanexedens]|uniref:toll/interleukin-1 receptor domain-containing protein n=1 Tax=Paenibacillus xylanexedens TaxID=528191 RepID=UPI00209FB8B8|nr:TIR domain-containing protein [Paenibacillus xylanexedens]MCP1425454.1 hypothetical protein [Paenibacillus xylanexedens]
MNDKVVELWMYEDNFKFFQNGLRSLYTFLNEYSDVINSFELRDLSFSKDIKKIRKVLDWTSRILLEAQSDDIEFTCSIETLTVLKAGGVTQIILLEREKEKLKKQNAPKKLIENINLKLSKYREIVDAGILKGLNPDELVEYLYDPEPTYEERVTQMTKMYEYDIALSFAGEDRKYADEIAKVLTQKGINVFYDLYEQANLWGMDLYSHLSTVYQDKAKFCLMFLSEHYARKAWTSHERKSAQARAFMEQREYILPLRIDNTEIPGIPATVGYIDIGNHTTEEIVDMIIHKLNNTK